MKKLLILFSFMALSLTVCATVRTVSNNPDNLAQFSAIQPAIDASNDGDTVYVYGGPNIYAGFTIQDKRITVIGPGWSPDKNLPHTVQVAGAVIRDSPAGGSPNGTEIQGLIFTQAITISRNQVAGDLPTNNLRFIRCQFNSNFGADLGASGLLVEGCNIYGTWNFNGAATYQNILFQNNFIFFFTCCVSTQINGLTNSVNVRFDHNLFASTNNGGGGNIFVFGNNARFITLTNNVFNQVNVGANVSFSTYNNNITNNITLNNANATSNATPWSVNNNVDGGGNVSNQSPAMVDQPQVNAGSSNALLNFTIASGPANNSGSDGKDMGLLFDTVGSLNWTNSRNSRLPRIFSMNIITPTVTPGGNLSVTVDARRSN